MFSPSFESRFWLNDRKNEVQWKIYSEVNDRFHFKLNLRLGANVNKGKSVCIMYVKFCI